MPKEIYLVKVGMTMTEGMVSEWYIADGQQVVKGEMLYALETEKINMDVDAETNGTVKHLIPVGEMMEPGDVVGFIFEQDEEVPEDLSTLPVNRNTAIKVVDASMEPGPEASSPIVKDQPVVKDGNLRIKSSPATRRLARELGVDLSTVTGSGPGGRIVEADVRPARREAPKASPLAKRLAAEKGIDISLIEGSGPGGRIVREDIEAALDKESEGPGQQAETGKTIPISGMRKTIAQRMFASLQNSAQLTMNMEVLMDDAVRLRDSLIEQWLSENVRPTYTDLVVKAVARALARHPMMNSQLGETEISLLNDINVGIAVALPDGLVVPVIRNAEGLSIKEISIESSRLASMAREGSLGLDDYAGGTFTVSSLGMYGVDSFTPIINSPQAGILGVNRIYAGVAWDDDRPVKTKKMNLSLTWDHRVLDGAPAAEFLAEVRELLSEPGLLLD